MQTTQPVRRGGRRVGASFSVQHKFVSCVNQIMNALVGKMHTPPFKIQGIKHLD
jgi:hypothetical protein